MLTWTLSQSVHSMNQTEKSRTGKIHRMVTSSHYSRLFDNKNDVAQNYTHSETTSWAVPGFFEITS